MKEKLKENDKKQLIQALLDKYLAGETSNEEEEILRNYFAEHGDEIPEEWKSFRALFSFVGFERINFLAEEESKEASEEISEEEPKAKQRNLRRYMAISAAAAIALILMITGIRSISNHAWGDTQPECYAVIDGKVYTTPEKVHDEALDALEGIGCEGQEDDAFEALNMMQ